MLMPLECDWRTVIKTVREQQPDYLIGKSKNVRLPVRWGKQTLRNAGIIHRKTGMVAKDGTECPAGADHANGVTELNKK